MKQNKIFAVIHVYDTDGGFGDAVTQEKVLFVTSDEEMAKKYVEENSNEHVYDVPYDELMCGKLIWRELPSAVPDPKSLTFLDDEGWK